MSSLKFIMDVDPDQEEPSKMDASSSRPGRREHESSSSSSAYGSHVYPSDRRRRSIDRPSDHIQDRPGPPGPGPGPVTASSSSSSSSSRSPKRSRGEGSEAPSQSQQRHASSAIAVSPSASPTSSSRPPPAASREGVPGRRSSSSAVAADAMDHRYYQQQPGLRQYAGQSSRVPAGSSLYGSGAQGQQLGPFPHHDYSHMVLPPPHTPQLSTSSPGVMVAAGPSSAGGSPMRPLGRPATPELPIKLTPITGRVSRAKKGVPVHTCDLCRPPKTFTRAEHLRRHQLSHQTPGFPCTYPGCDRAFHRPDLLSRHQQRHEQENGDKRSRGGSSTDDASRRTSAASLEEGASRLGLQTPAGAQPSGTSPGATAGSGTTQSTSTMSDAASAPNFSAGGNAGVRSASPQASGDNYRHHGAASTGGGANASANENRKTSGGSFNPYTLSPSIAVVNAPDNGIGGSSPVSPHRSPGAGRRDGGRGPTFSSMDPQPRTTPNFSLYVVTQNLGLPSLQIPTTSSSSHRRSASAGGAGDDGALSAGSLLAPPHEMVSPFASSSTSDSTFSTPSDVTRRSWHGFGAGTSSAVPVSPYPRTGAGSGLASPFPELAHGPLETTPAGQIHHRQTPYFLHVPFGGSGGSPSPVDAGFGDDDGSGAISSMFDTLSASSFDDSPYGSADPDVSSLMAAGGYGQFGQDHGMARRNDHHYHQQPHHNLSVRSPVLSSSFPFSTPAPPLRNVQSSELQPSSLVAPATAPLPDRLSALAAVGRRLGGHRSKVGTGGLTRVEKRGSVGPGDRAAARISRRRLSSVIANIGVVTGPVGDSMRPALSGQPPPQLEDGIGSAWLSGDCGMRKSEAVVFVTPTTPIGHDSHLRALAGDGCSDSSQTALSLATSTAVPVVYHATDGAVDYTADQVANHPSSQAPATGPAVASTLSRATRNAIPAYLDVYWARLHPLLPIVHRPSFDEAIALADGAMEGETGSARKTSKTSSMFATTMAGPGAEVLRCAMAAIATQYFDTKDDHIRGNQLHEHVWLEAKRFPCMNLAVMQAIFLCEYFARFRGRKAVIKPSRAFEALYHGLADSPTLAEACPPRRSSRTATAGSADEDQRDTQRRWRLWIELEGRRRLLAACFVLDIHSSIYHEQPRTRHFVLPPEVGAQLSSGSAADSGTAGRPVLPGHGFPIPLTERSMALWAAESADEWAALADGDPEAAGPAFLPDPRSLTVESISGRPPFDHAILLAAEALRLAASPEATTPTQMPPTPQSAMHMDVDSVGGSSVMTPVTPLSATTASAAVSATSALAVTSLSTLFATCPVANAYLALHHTPLHDLLAVSGDSWVFSQKILQPTSFLEHQKRLKEWASGGSGSGSGSGSRLGPHHRRSLSTSASPPSTDALMATRFAARSLVCFLDSGVRPPEQVHGDGGGSGQDQRQCAARRGRMDDIGDYWAIYVCALIIWAVGHRERRSRSISMSAAAPVRAPTVISSSPSSSSSSSSSAATVTAETAAAAGGAESSTSSTANSQNSQHRPQAGITGPDNGGRRATLATATSDAEALAWLRHVAALTRPEDIAEARSAPGAAAVVGLVRRHLDNASSGQRGRLFVDAVRVLRKLDEGLNWKWF